MGGQKDQRIIKRESTWSNMKEKICTKCFKNLSNKCFVSFGETKFNRDKLFCLKKEDVNQIELTYKIGTQFYRKTQKRGSSLQNLPTIPKYGSTHGCPQYEGVLMVDNKTKYFIYDNIEWYDNMINSYYI